MANLIERHREKIVGVLSCFDRLVLQGTLPSVAYPQAVATELDSPGALIALEAACTRPFSLV